MGEKYELQEVRGSGIGCLLVVAGIVIGAALFAFAGVALADENICVDDTGAEGIVILTGECVTPAVYDDWFSFENLSKVPTLIGASVAEVYVIEPAPVASVRPRVFQGAPEPTFVEYVAYLHGRGVL